MTERNCSLRSPRQSELPRDEVGDLLLHIKGLVLVRGLLQQRGATETELEEHSAEIGRLQWRLARLVERNLNDGTAR
jgi:hypothetical protein